MEIPFSSALTRSLLLTAAMTVMGAATSMTQIAVSQVPPGQGYGGQGYGGQGYGGQGYGGGYGSPNSGYGYPNGGYGSPNGGYGYPNGGYGSPGRGYADSGAASGSDPSVASIQRRLADLGYFKGEVTGGYDPATEEAIVQFQRDAGLAPDGIVGPATESALNGRANGVAQSPDQPGSDPSSTSGGFLQLNNSSDQVTDLQRRLSELGYYNGSASGSFDSQTQAAVIKFQQDNGLATDGIVGPATEAALSNPKQSQAAASQGYTASGSSTSDSSTNNSPSGSSSGLLRLGDAGDAVSALQQHLKNLGFYDGDVTGSYSPQTEAAVMDFQRSHNLTQDGIAGPQVAAALDSASPASGTASATTNATTDNATGTGTTGTTTNTATNSTGATTGQTPSEVEKAKQEAEQARLEAEQARLEAEQARQVFQQNMQEGRYSVIELQRRLQGHGYNPGDVSGVMTPETQKALTDAQQKYGLSQGDLYLNSSSPSSSPSFSGSSSSFPPSPN